MTGTKNAGIKTAGLIVRVCGVVAGLAAAVSGWDAEAGWRRRCCGTACCEPVCCEPVRQEPVCCETVRYEPACCEPRVVVATCPTRCETLYDACGRRIETTCGCTVVSTWIVSPEQACCAAATPRSEVDAETGGPTLAVAKAKPPRGVTVVAARGVRRR